MQLPYWGSATNSCACRLAMNRSARAKAAIIFSSLLSKLPFVQCSAALSRNRRTGFLKLALSPSLSSWHLLLNDHLFPLLLIFLAYLRIGRDAQLGFIPRSSSASLQQFFHSHKTSISLDLNLNVFFSGKMSALPWFTASCVGREIPCIVSEILEISWIWDCISSFSFSQ